MNCTIQNSDFFKLSALLGKGPVVEDRLSAKRHVREALAALRDQGLARS